MSKSKKPAKKPVGAASKRAMAGGADRPKCGLCGATKNLTKTECCGNWICDDEGNYVLFSYAHTSCSRNHRRYTSCGAHSASEHAGPWKECQKCRKDIPPEMYAYYATNEYNFDVLENPPPFEPTKCGKCGRVIRLSEGGTLFKVASTSATNARLPTLPAPLVKPVFRRQWNLMGRTPPGGIVIRR